MSTFKKALLQLHVFVFLAGLTGPIGNYIQLNGLMLVFYRMMITSIVAILLYLIASPNKVISNKYKIKLIGIGAIIALHWVCFYGSIKLANVSIALVCFSTIGLFTVLLDPFFTKRPILLNELGIGLLSLAGILFIFKFDTEYRLGILVGLASSLLAAIFTLFNKKLTTHILPQTIQTFEMSGGFIFLAIIVLLVNFMQGNPLIVPSFEDWGWLILLSLVCTVWANYLMLSALKHVSAFTLNITLNLEPVYGIVLAFFLFQEQKQLGYSFYIGLCLIAFSVFLQMRKVIFEQSAKTQG